MLSFQVVVGDILKVRNGELFPADLLLLTSSEGNGTCYVETSKIDGETNLKVRSALQCTSHLKNVKDIGSFFREIECEEPNESINDFSGTLITEDGQEWSLGFFS